MHPGGRHYGVLCAAGGIYHRPDSQSPQHTPLSVLMCMMLRLHPSISKHVALTARVEATSR